MALTRPKYSQIYDTDWKQSVEAGTIGSDIGNLIVGNTQPSILDGFSLSIGNRILVKDQTDGTQNGLYRVANVGSGSNGWWVRTLDANQSGFVTSGLTVVVDAGTVNGGREFRLITQDPITLGSTSLTFISQTGNPGGANTQVQFYDSISGIPQLSGTPGFTYNKTSNAVVMSGNLSVYGINAIGNISTPLLNAGQINTTGNILSTGAIHNSLTINGTTTAQAINSSGYINTTANISTAQLNAGQINTSGNVLATNAVLNALTVNGVTTQNGNLNISNGNLNVTGTIWITGNILPTANVTYNLGSPTNKFKSAYFSGNTVYIGSESMGVDPSGTWQFTSNGATVTLGASAAFNPSVINASANITSPQITATTNLTAAAITAPFIGNTGASLIGTIATAAQPNITSVGILTGLNTSGNISSVIDNTNLLNSSGNVIANTVSAYALSGIITTASQTNITQVGNLTSLSVSGASTFYSTPVIAPTTNATTLGTGALIVQGGGSFAKDLYVGGNLYAANVVSVNYSYLTVNDPLIYLQGNVYPYNFSIGFYGHFIGGPANAYAHTGFVRSWTNNAWYLFSNIAEPIAGNVNVSDANLIYDPLYSGSITVAGAVNASGNVLASTVNAGQINTTGNVLATGGVYNALTVNGNESITGYLNVTGNILTSQLTAGQINTSGNIIATTAILNALTVNGGITSTGYFNTTANISTAQLNAGQINTTGNVLAVNFVGSGSLLTVLPGYAYSNVNVIAYTQTMGYSNYSNVNLIAYLAGSITSTGFINTTGNVSAAVHVGGAVNVSGNVLSTGAVHNSLIVNGTASTNVASAASTILAGAVGVTGNIIANASVVYGNPTGLNGVRQFYNPVTNSLDTVFG